ncbi:spore maturation protein [bacterium AH-315-G05]|nr:spore maturation protein [Alkaliphilus transvaalensis]MBN4069827.1 spore maturation protein [bacterium AH-315-G05]
MSIMVIPIMITSILLHGLYKKINVYDIFVEGAEEGLMTALRIMPYLIAIFFAIGIMRRSGSIDIIVEVLAPVFEPLGIPKEVLPLALMRPFSGSGSLAMLRDIISQYGADSFIGRVASTMMGSAETIFFTMAVYFGAVGIKRARYTLVAAIISHFAAVIASVFIVNLIF